MGELIVMSRRRKLLRWALATVMASTVLLASKCVVPYYTACLAADQYVFGAADGPWVRSNTRPVLDYDLAGSRFRVAPHWVFRYQNPITGMKSVRIHVTFRGDCAYSHEGLDPFPMLGILP